MNAYPTIALPRGKDRRKVLLWDRDLAGQAVLVAADRPDAGRRLAEALARSGADVTVESGGISAAVTGLRRLSNGDPLTAVVFDLERDWPGGLHAAVALRNAGYKGIVLAFVDEPRGSLADRWRKAGGDPVPRPVADATVPHPLETMPALRADPAHLPGG